MKTECSSIDCCFTSIKISFWNLAKTLILRCSFQSDQLFFNQVKIKSFKWPYLDCLYYGALGLKICYFRAVLWNIFADFDVLLRIISECFNVSEVWEKCEWNLNTDTYQKSCWKFNHKKRFHLLENSFCQPHACMILAHVMMMPMFVLICKIKVLFTTSYTIICCCELLFLTLALFSDISSVLYNNIYLWGSCN